MGTDKTQTQTVNSMAVAYPPDEPPQGPSKNARLKKHKILLISIIACIIVVVASGSWFAIKLVRDKNEDRLRDNENDVDYNYGGVSTDQTTRDATLGIFFCPPPGDPVTLDLVTSVIVYNSANNDQQHRIILGNSPEGILCTLLEVSDDGVDKADGNLRLKPIGRSYNGSGWEPYHGLHSAFNTVPLSCSESDSQDCLVHLPPLDLGRKYILKSYEHSLGPRDEAARFLEKTTFGATNSEIDAFVASGSNPSEWVKEQVDLSTISSHRQFFRHHATNFHPETTWMGTLSFKPCEAGSLYRKFVFMPKDEGHKLTIATSPIDANYRILMVEGQIRSVIPGRVKQYISENNWPVVPDGSYEICHVTRGTSIGKPITIKVGSECYPTLFDGVVGNPIVKLDEQHMSLVNQLVTIDGSAREVSVRETQMLKLTSDITDGGCMTEETTGAPEVVTIASYGNEFWIHTPFFRLVDNQIETPLIDGGKSAMEATENAPHVRMKVFCSNAPRTFLNEDSCVLSDNACSSQNTSAAIVCGSPYEVANNPDPGTFRGSFDIRTQFNRTMPQGFLRGQKETVWLQIALNGKDQLRQRMAWALSQILVVSPNSITQDLNTESFETYYDIFVRHAFGNYFDILKEVTYSPLMAEMLTYNNGVSTGYAWLQYKKLHHADENYARELLQLFSVGLYSLNDDGTIETDDNGHEIRTYTNQDISEYAKVFVGFKKRSKRGNIEDITFPGGNQNDIDPLEIFPEFKDHFPKLGMNNRYIGDGYPLCKDISSGNFLKKGATFRLLGSSPNPELLNDPEDWWGSDPVRLSLDKSSVLSSILCNKRSGERCAPLMKVVLDSDIECYGVECTVQELRAFEVFEGSNVWFEYIRPPCVNHAFYEGAQSMRRRRGQTGHAMCGDPGTYAASTACCEATSMSNNTTIRQEVFSGERVSLDFAEKRCSSLSTMQELCHNPLPRNRDCKNNGGCDNYGKFYWSSSGCILTAKVNQEGKVALIHNPQVEGVETYKMLADNTEMFFRVDWESDDTDSFIPNLISNCARFGCTNGEGSTCICPTLIEETAAFVNEEDLLSVENVLSMATLGAFRYTEENFYPVNGVNGLSKYPQGDISLETIFKVIDSNDQIHFRKNVKNVVQLGTSFKFRNPVMFYSLSEPTTRDAAYETDAALHHAFFHQNMAPFVSFRLAQRFGLSNPSPRYIQSISRAFRGGLYIHSSTGMRIGSGQYGCLKATIAAVLLDKESVDPILDADPAHGSIQEPYLKIVKVMRALEFRPTKRHPLLNVGLDLQLLVGQQSHKLPNVFSFFRPEYQPAGRVSSAGMISPESQVLSGPSSIQLTNTIISFLKYGVSACYGGFGNLHFRTCRIGDTTPNGGDSSYDPKKYDLLTATDIVDDLSTLLTSGRLDERKREVVQEAYEDTIARGKTSKEAVINAQQLVVTSPEFHAANLGRTSGQTRPSSVLSEPTNIPYKAVVFVMLPGGYDSFNVLVPKECTNMNPGGKTVRDQYLEQRGSIAFNEVGEFDLDIDATDSNQPCTRFAIHDELKVVKDLYDAGDLAFFANAGIINESGLTKQNYHRLTRSQLFAHNAMQLEIAKVDPYDKIAGTGIMGRAKDVLSKNGHVVGTISIDNPSVAVDGMQSQPASIIGRSGSKKFAVRPEEEFDFDIEKYARTINGKVDEFSGIFGETWSEKFIKGIDDAEEYQSIFDLAQLNEFTLGDIGQPDFTGESDLEQEHWEKWSSLSKLIQRKDLRNVDRDLFFTELGRWDHHNQMKTGLRSELHALNFGLEMFVKQAKSAGFWDEVAVVIASDFGRTLTPNSNDGTDHGWGGHYMVLGGDVKGGKILGEYPSDLTPSGLLVDDRGRFLPTTSWDSIWNGILEWTGVTEQTDLDYCLPNRFRTVDPVLGTAKKFPLLTASSIFNSQEGAEGGNLRGRNE